MKRKAIALLLSIAMICQVTPVYAMDELADAQRMEQIQQQEESDPVQSEEQVQEDEEESEIETYAEEAKVTLDPVTGLSAQGVGKNRVQISWNPVEGAEGYIIYRKIGSGKSEYIMMTSGTSRIDTSASGSEFNFYFVYPYYTENGKRVINTRNASYTYAKGSLPEAENVKAERGGKNKVKISWSSVSGAEGYIIYKRGTDGKFSYIGMTGKDTYTDVNASGVEYNFYKIYPYYKENGKNVIGTVKGYVYAKAGVSAVPNLKAQNSGNNIKITWEKVDEVDGYIIYRRVGNNSFKYLYIVGGYSSSYLDTTASACYYNYYRVYPYYKDTNGKRILGASNQYVYGASETTPDHNFTELIDHKDSTCVEKGYDKYKCEKCDETKTVELDLINHKYEITKTVKPTCQKEGYKEYTCTVCGDSYKESIDKVSHDYKLTKTVDATCEKNGYKEYTCTMCGDSYQKVTDKKLGHDFSKKVDHKDSTCIEKGYDKYQCTRCDETKTVELDLINHKYEITKTVKPTCQKEGYKEYTCTVCGDSYKESIDKVSHDYKLTKTVDATCEKNGYKEYTCTMCGDSYKTVIPKLGHEHEYVKTVNPTCTEDGYKLYQCTRCDDSYTESIEKLGHDFSELVEHKDSTCVEQGYDLYKCSRCDETQKNMYDLIPHDYDMTVEVERVNSTCTTHGHVNYACKVCGDIHTEELELDPNNHTFVETGRDLQYIYYKCSECGTTSKEFNDQEYTIDLGNGQTTTVVGHFDLEMRQQILNLVNEQRAYYGGGQPLLTLVGENTTLQKAADIRAIEITYLYSHTRPNGERAIMSLYPFAHTDAENLAEGQTSAEMVCNDWFSSLTHNQNIVRSDFRSIGISVFCTKDEDGKYVNYFSQLFSTLTPNYY